MTCDFHFFRKSSRFILVEKNENGQFDNFLAWSHFRQFAKGYIIQVISFILPAFLKVNMAMSALIKDNIDVALTTSRVLVCIFLISYLSRSVCSYFQNSYLAVAACMNLLEIFTKFLSTQFIQQIPRELATCRFRPVDGICFFSFSHSRKTRRIVVIL